MYIFRTSIGFLQYPLPGSIPAVCDKFLNYLDFQFIWEKTHQPLGVAVPYHPQYLTVNSKTLFHDVV